MDPSLLDTDTVSEILKQRDTAVIDNAAAYLQQYGQFNLSAFTRYEIRRGYVDKKASRQLVKFDLFCSQSLVIPVTAAVFDRAADLWATARQSGHPKSDADLIIGATAQEHNLVLVTGNRRHFDWMPGLRIEDWREL